MKQTKCFVKKLVSLMLVLVMTASMLLPVFAAPVAVSGFDTARETSVFDDVALAETNELSNAKISVKNVYVIPGDKEVEVVLSIDNNQGIAGLRLKLEYNEQVIQLVEAKNGVVFSDSEFQSGDLNSGCSFAWLRAINTTRNGKLMTLKFNVLDEASYGKYPITLSYNAKDITNANKDVLDVDIINGEVCVLSYRPGDANGDGYVTIADAVDICKSFVSSSVTINEIAADVDADGGVTMIDAVSICQSFIPSFGVTLLPGKEICDHVNMTFTEAVEKTCTTDGNVAYYYCTDCGEYYSNSEGTIPVAQESIVIPAGHTPGTVATCTQAQTCEDCGEVLTAAKGHTEVTVPGYAATTEKEGLTDGIKCSVCNEWVVKQEIIDKLLPEQYSITYNNLKGASIPVEYTQYTEHKGLLDLPEPSAEGYRFDAWYTKSVGGDVVDYIPAGSTQNYVLFARWELEPYKIRYNNAPNFTETPYTIEEEVVLSAPEWPGLIFSGWIDESGDTITKINKGSTGSIVITATWREKENYAVPTNGIRKLWIHYDEEYSQQYFVYDLGTIYNVVLETFRTKDKMVGESIDWSYTNEVSFGQSNSETASKAVTHSVSQTVELSETNEWAKSHSHTFERGFTIGGEWSPIKDILSFNLSGEFNWSDTDEQTWGTASTNGVSDSESEEFSDSYSSTITFNKTVTESITTTTHIGEQMPAGTYRNVAYGSVRVFAVVTYDVNSGNYRVDTFSVLNDEIGEMTLYEPPVESNINIQANAGLALDIPLDELETYMNKAYYVQYIADDASGSMMISAHISDEAHELSENLFTKAGYTWTGWRLENGSIVTAGAEVFELGTSGDLITVTAVWAANPYEVTFDANGGTVGTSTAIVTYDRPYGTLPKPIRTGYTFSGWRFGDDIIKSDTKVSFDGPHTLVAQWNANEYTVTFNANGGSVSHSSKTVTYDSEYGSLPAPTRSGYGFIGWYTASSGGTRVENSTIVETASNHTLYARWLKISYSQFFGVEESTYKNHSYTLSFSPEFEKQALLDNGYKNVSIYLKFHYRKNGWAVWYNTSGEVKITSNDGTISFIGVEDYEAATESSKIYELNVTANINNLGSDGSFRIEFIGDGGDTNHICKISDITLEIVALK